MNEMMNWDDIRLFLMVARGGGLTGAISSSGLSAPTLGRRMFNLEHRLSAELFIRHRDGYALTDMGRELLGHAEAAERRFLEIERWRSGIETLPVVKIAAGAWTSIFIAKHLSQLSMTETDPGIEIITGSGQSSLARREANIGLRNARPDANGLAGKRLVKVAFAIYGGEGFVEGNSVARGEDRYRRCPWVVFSATGPKVPSTAWLERHPEIPIKLTCSTSQAAISAVKEGAGLCVLPCFIGDSEAGLTRASDPIPELEHDQWIVSHDDDRHTTPIRTILDRLAALIQERRALFAGELGAVDR